MTTSSFFYSCISFVFVIVKVFISKNKCRSNRYTKHQQLMYLLVSVCRASPQKPATIMRLQLQPLPPSMFRDLAVPHFRPVPFRILDRSSVPFRSAPFREIVTTMVAQECTSTSRPQRDRPCSALCLHYVRTTPVVFPHSFRSISAIFPHCYYSVVFPHRFRGISAVFPHCSRGISALLPQSFRTVPAVSPHCCRSPSAVLPLSFF